MLNEREWNTINNILLELYTIENIDLLSQKLFLVLRMLISYTKGYMILLDENRNIIEDKSHFEGMADKGVSDYINRYYNDDYLRLVYEISPETMVYRDSDIMNDDIRMQTDFFKKFLKFEDIPYGCGILIVHQKRVIAIFNLFRNDVYGDFSDKDIYILNILKRHIENMVYKNVYLNRQKTFNPECFEIASKKYELTKRESEILMLVCQGMLNNEICDMLSISLSTVKKHIYNLYIKTGVKSRTQLVNLVYNCLGNN